MSNIFMSYAHATKKSVRAIVNGLEFEGWRVWWDEQLKGGVEFAMEIERELDSADHVLVAWSEPARRSVWVRGEALEALDKDKLVQIQLDRGKPPVPFNALHAINFRDWDGTRGSPAWRTLASSLGEPSSGDQADQAAPAPKPEPKPMPLRRRRRPPRPPGSMQLADAVTGASVHATIISLIASLAVLFAVGAGVAGALSADLFIALTSFVFGASLLASAISVKRLLRTDTSMRRAQP